MKREKKATRREVPSKKEIIGIGEELETTKPVFLGRLAENRYHTA